MGEIKKGKEKKKVNEPWFFWRNRFLMEHRAPAHVRDMEGGQEKQVHTGQTCQLTHLVSFELLNSLNTWAQTISKLLLAVFAVLRGKVKCRNTQEVKGYALCIFSKHERVYKKTMV